MKKMTTASLLVTPLIAHSLQAFASDVQGDKNAFARYVVPTHSSLALCHFKGSEINGAVTIDISSTDSIKTATIKVFDDGSMDDESSASLLKFALLKSINLGCSKADIVSSGNVVTSEEFSSFGKFEKSGATVSFGSLPHADFSTLSSYGYHGFTSAATALLSIGFGMLTQASESTLAKSFTPAFATSGFSSKK